MSTITQVQNYQGSNSFIIKMKDAIKKYGSLTSKQAAAVEKILNAPVEAKQVELSDDMKKIQSYEGTNSFVKEIQSKLEKYGKKYHVSSVYTDSTQMFENEYLDCVSICTLVDTHLDLVLQAAKNNVKAIFLEKPISNSLKSAREIVKICNNNNI